MENLMPRKVNKTKPTIKLSSNLGNHLLENTETEPVTVVEQAPVESEFKYEASESAKVETTDTSAADEPDYALYYYSKGPKNYSAGSAWFGSFFSLLAIGGVATLFLLRYVLVENHIKFEPPYVLLNIAWLVCLAWIGLVSIGCGVFGLLTAKEDGFSRKPAVAGILITLFSGVLALLPVFLIW